MGARRLAWCLGLASWLAACGSGTPSRYGVVSGNSSALARRVLVPCDSSLPAITQQVCSQLCPRPLRDEYLPSCQQVGGSDELLADVAPGASALLLCAYQRRGE